MRINPGIGGVIVALLLHAGLFLWMANTSRVAAVPVRKQLALVLSVPQEAPVPRFIVASLPQPENIPDPRGPELPAAQPVPQPPEEKEKVPSSSAELKPPPETPQPQKTPTPAAPSPPAQQQLGADDLKQLAQEHAELEQKLKGEQIIASSMAANVVGQAMGKMTGAGMSATGSRGTVRELDFGGGWRKAIIDDVMNRYKLRITQKVVTGRSNQSYLSSAASGEGDHFYSNSSNTHGVYDVFELSQLAVAKMSELEEQEIRNRNLDLEKTRVTYVKFGIVPSKVLGADLGITDFKYETIP